VPTIGRSATAGPTPRDDPATVPAVPRSALRCAHSPRRASTRSPRRRAQKPLDSADPGLRRARDASRRVLIEPAWAILNRALPRTAMLQEKSASSIQLHPSRLYKIRSPQGRGGSSPPAGIPPLSQIRGLTTPQRPGVAVAPLRGGWSSPALPVAPAGTAPAAAAFPLARGGSCRPRRRMPSMSRTARP
jgi:hypothetical protein